MTNKDIEEFAIDAVKKSVRLTQVLEQYIPENDKEPSWDGKVYIYNNEKKLKSDLIGRVDVQVKGKISEKHDLEKIKHKVAISDLKNYLNDSGIIYFVVLISEDGEQSKIYYNTLLPVKIKQILSSTKNEKNITLEFEALHDDNRDKVNLFRDFHMNSQRQISYVNYSIPTIEELEKQYGQLELVHTLNAYGYTSSMDALISNFLEREAYTYAKVDGRLIPLADIGKLFAIGEELTQSIKVNNKEYYTSFTRMHTKNGISIKIGESLEILFEKQADTLTLKFAPANMLNSRLKDLEFILDAFQNQAMSINDIELNLSPSNLNLEKCKLEGLKEKLDYYKKIQELLKILNIKDDLNLTNLSEKEAQDLFCLVTGIVDKQLVRHKVPKDSKYLFFKIQKIGISILAKESVEGSSEYEYINVFSGKLAFSANEHSKPTYPVYCMLKKEHYINFSNINYSEMLLQYKYFGNTNPNIYSQANLDVLQMILAYDVCKKSIIIDTAIDIMQWILQHEEENNRSKAIYQINYLQAIARLREISEKEQETLINISMSDDSCDDIKFAVNVLLKQLPSAKAYLRKLIPSEVEQIKEFPIYSLYEKLKLREE